MDSEDAGRLVGTTEAAQLLGVATSTIRRWARRGLLPSAVPGPPFAFDVAALRRPSTPLRRHRPDHEEEPLVGVPWVADRLQISDVLVRRLVAGGGLERVRVGNRDLFRRAAVERFVDGLEADPQETVPLTRAAAELGINPRTLKRYAAADGLQLVVGLDRARHLRRSDLARLLEQPGPRHQRPGSRDDLTTGDVALLLARSPEWVRQRAIAGQIPHRLSPGGRRTFRLEDLALPEPRRRGDEDSSPAV